MRKSIGPGVTVMLLVLMLGAMAIGYALWSKTLTIRSEVRTGSVHAFFENAFTDDDDFVDNPDKDSQDTGDCEDIGGVEDASPFENKDPDDGLTSCDPAATGRDPKPHYDKDVARCDARVDENDNNVAHVLKRNVYPSYHCTAWFDILIDGTIPVKVAHVLINGVPIVPSVPTPIDLSGDGDADVEIHISEIRLCDQLHPGDTVQMDIDQHILQEAPQGATLGYTVQVQLNQWNEPGVFCVGDRIIDADGIASAGDGIGNCGVPATPGAVDVFVGAPLTSWPAGDPDNHGIDILEAVVDSAWTSGCNGDDIHIEGSSAACPTGVRNAIHDLGADCKVLDFDGSLAQGDTVDCDLESGTFCTGTLLTDLVFYDANGDGAWDDGEDIVIDANGNGVFD